jgi:DNA repair exonuclease SbcCD ATPase subunit
VNARAREAMAKLHERDARVRREQETLEVVRRELRDLERFVQRDVDIIRDRIEEQDRLLATARGRFTRAKAEFDAAAADMENLSTKKNALTAHLTTILEENEARKLAHLEKIHSLLERAGQ